MQEVQEEQYGLLEEEIGVMGMIVSFVFGMLVGAILICIIAIIYGKNNDSNNGQGEG